MHIGGEAHDGWRSFILQWATLHACIFLYSSVLFVIFFFFFSLYHILPFYMCLFSSFCCLFLLFLFLFFRLPSLWSILMILYIYCTILFMIRSGECRLRHIWIKHDIVTCDDLLHPAFPSAAIKAASRPRALAMSDCPWGHPWRRRRRKATAFFSISGVDVGNAEGENYIRIDLGLQDKDVETVADFSWHPSLWDMIGSYDLIRAI